MFRFKSSASMSASILSLCFNTSYVSVQESNDGLYGQRNVSFNTSYVSVQGFMSGDVLQVQGYVSIHPMFRFKSIALNPHTPKEILFQYILCFGSRKQFFDLEFYKLCFNTSYVSVQEAISRVEFGANGSFNTSYVSVQVHHLKLLKNSHKSFNTSYVSVQVL